MPNKKLTDNEIVKALECCGKPYNICAECPMPNDIKDDCKCGEHLANYALDLINRLQAENERLQNILICFMDALGKVRKVDDIDEISLIPLMSELNKQYRAELKAEAYKECIEKVKEKSKKTENVCSGALVTISYAISNKNLDNLLKELESNSDEVHNTASPEN